MLCTVVVTHNLLYFLNGIIYLPFLELPIIIFREVKMRPFEVGQSTIKSLVRLHRCAGWPGCKLVAKANRLWFWLDKG